jgi:hypothetical protein
MNSEQFECYQCRTYFEAISNCEKEQLQCPLCRSMNVEKIWWPANPIDFIETMDRQGIGG